MSQDRWDYALLRARRADDPEERIETAQDLLAIARQCAGVACPACRGWGRQKYADTSTWRRSVFAGQASTEDVCDVCWGTGRSDVTGPNLREMMEVGS